MTTTDQAVAAGLAPTEAPKITVHYERKFSDGTYGSEGYSFSVTAAGNPEYFAEDNFSHIAKALREAVLTELSRSAAPAIARAASYELNPPAPRPAARDNFAPDESPF